MVGRQPSPPYHRDHRPSWSSVHRVLDCPADARWQADQEREDSAAMAVGRLMHCAILEPERLDADYTTPPRVVCLPGWEAEGTRGAWTVEAMPGRTWGTKGAAEAEARPWGWQSDAIPCPTTYAKQADAVAGLGSLARGSWVDADLLALVREWAQGPRDWLDSLPGARWHELPLEGAIQGVACRGCADVVGSVVVDVKGCGDVSARGVQQAALGRHWHGQLATYAELLRQMGRPVDGQAVLVVQLPTATLTAQGLRGGAKQPRPHWRVEWLDAAGVEHGRRQMAKAWSTYRDCGATGIWPDHVGGLAVPEWAAKALGDVPAAGEW